jgi:hypothetical protein
VRGEFLLLTGHSLGGAAVNVAHYYVADNFFDRPELSSKPTEIQSYTFGAPRSFNEDLANQLDRDGYRFFQVRHEEDIVPSVPPMTLFYRQNGILVYHWWNGKYPLSQSLTDDLTTPAIVQGAPQHAVLAYLNSTLRYQRSPDGRSRQKEINATPLKLTFRGKNGSGQITVADSTNPGEACGKNCFRYLPYTRVTLAVKPDSGNWVGWQGCDEKTADTCTVTMFAEREVVVDYRRYAKSANNGSRLADSAKLGTKPKEWACTLDKETGLVWEIKTDDGGLRDWRNRYSWYDPDPATNGGFAGYQSNGDGGSGSCTGGILCNTHAYTQAVNARGLCGGKDWRMPAVEELLSLVNRAYFPTIELGYFPDTYSYYWSSSPVASSDNSAWLVYFYNGYDVRGPLRATATMFG